jgi:hypothetical protein
MTEIEVSLCDQKLKRIVKYTCLMCYNNSLVLASREERAALLKTGLTGKDVESLYLKLNDIIVIGINWQDLKSK